MRGGNQRFLLEGCKKWEGKRTKGTSPPIELAKRKKGKDSGITRGKILQSRAGWKEIQGLRDMLSEDLMTE